MAETEQTKPDSQSEQSSDDKPAKRRWIRLPGWPMLLLLALLVANLVGVGYVASRPPRLAGITSPEISLGEYRFETPQSGETSIRNAEFTLHVSLLPELDQSARALLATHEFRVRQDIEQLMRQANGRDFEDPRLAELKRQLQETVNTTVGERIVADVIVTQLEVAHSEATKTVPATREVGLPPADPAPQDDAA